MLTESSKCNKIDNYENISQPPSHPSSSKKQSQQHQQNQQQLLNNQYYSFCQTKDSPPKLKSQQQPSINIVKKPNPEYQQSQQTSMKKSSLENNNHPSLSQYNYSAKSLCESMNDQNSLSLADLNNSMPIRKGRSQKSKVQEQLNEANKSLQAFRDKSNELQQRQNKLKSQQIGLNEKQKKFDKEIGDFTLNSKQLSEYTSEVQRDLKKVNQNQKEVVQDTRLNLNELANQLLQYRDQSQIMELLGDAISQKDEVMKRIIEKNKQSQNQEIEQILQQRELEKLLVESNQSIEDLDKKIKELTLQNQQLSSSLKEKADKINELVLNLSEKDLLEINLRKQIYELNQSQTKGENEFLKMHEKTLLDNFAIKERTFQQRISQLENQLHEKNLLEQELRTKIVDLEREIKKYQKLGKQTEILNVELKDVLLSKQSEIDQLKLQIDGIHQLHEQDHQQFKSKLTQKIKQCMELQSNSSSPDQSKINQSQVLNTSSHKLSNTQESIQITNQSFERPQSKSQHISSIGQMDSTRTAPSTTTTRTTIIKQNITQIEKEQQMNQVFNELKLFNEQTNKPTLSQMKLKTMTNVSITPIITTIRSNYVSRDTSADYHHNNSSQQQQQPQQQKQQYNSQGNVNVIISGNQFQNTQQQSVSASNIFNANQSQITQISQSSSTTSSAYHPPLSQGGSTAQYLQNRIVNQQKFVFKHPHHPQKIIELSPISRQNSSMSSASKQIYLMKQSNVSNGSITPPPSHLNSSINKQTQQ